jgi:hypothetical protein
MWRVWAMLTLSGCVAFRQYVGGLAVWPVLFAAEIDDPELQHLEPWVATTMFVAVVEVGDGLFEPEDLPVEGAEVSARTGLEPAVSLTEVRPGFYAFAPGSLPYIEDTIYDVRVSSGDVDVFHRAPAASRLRVEPFEGLHRRGRTLRVPMPDGYEEEFDQVLVKVVDPEGRLTWSNQPETAEQVLSWASVRFVPDVLAIPGEAFPDAATLYGVVLIGVVRARERSERSPELRSELSGFTTGAGIVLKVETEP